MPKSLNTHPMSISCACGRLGRRRRRQGWWYRNTMRSHGVLDIIPREWKQGESRRSRRGRRRRTGGRRLRPGRRRNPCQRLGLGARRRPRRWRSHYRRAFRTMSRRRTAGPARSRSRRLFDEKDCLWSDRSHSSYSRKSRGTSTASSRTSLLRSGRGFRSRWTTSTRAIQTFRLRSERSRYDSLPPRPGPDVLLFGRLGAQSPGWGVGLPPVPVPVQGKGSPSVAESPCRGSRLQRRAHGGESEARREGSAAPERRSAQGAVRPRGRGAPRGGGVGGGSGGRRGRRKVRPARGGGPQRRQTGPGAGAFGAGGPGAGPWRRRAKGSASVSLGRPEWPISPGRGGKAGSSASREGGLAAAKAFTNRAPPSALRLAPPATLRQVE